MVLVGRECGPSRIPLHPGSRLLSLPPRLAALSSPAQADASDWPAAEARPVPGSPSPVMLWVEPLGSAVDSDTPAPVVFPGYLLPDDRHEEPVHEGS